ncbi:MAG: MBL fold metallo-hydrolase [Actinomycetia bacterium]|nr:MBL fold metallo-hydrolase [Actinomycetes bacterium]
MRIANNVEMLEVPTPAPHHPVLIWDDDDVVLIDTSFPGELPALEAELARCGFTIEQVNKVILTHQDIDHIGNAKAFRAAGAELMAGAREVRHIQGDEPLTKLADMEANLDQLPPERAGFHQMLKDAAPALYTPVDTALADGQELPLCGGIRVVFAPGHTPGHIVLLLCAANVVVCGDAANIVDGQLVGSNPQMTHDTRDAEASLARIKSLGASGYLSYHTGYLAS